MNDKIPLFAQDIEPKVLEGIVLQILSSIEGVAPIEGNLFASFLGREFEGSRGIFVDEDSSEKSVTIRVEINVAFGVAIPKKAAEVQTKLAEGICSLTGLKVSGVHVVFKGLISRRSLKEEIDTEEDQLDSL